MAITATYTRGYSCSGLSFGANATVSSALATPWSVDLPVAKVGQLTTRTDSDTGVLTMTGGHGITTGRIDVYWTGGSRYGMAGTVTTNSIAIDGGAGDNLPANLTAITAINPSSEAVVVTGNNVVAIATRFPGGGTAVFAASDNTAVLAVSATATNQTYVYSSSDGGTNPVAGGAITHVWLSQGAQNVNTATGIVQFN